MEFDKYYPQDAIHLALRAAFPQCQVVATPIGFEISTHHNQSPFERVEAKFVKSGLRTYAKLTKHARVTDVPVKDLTAADYCAHPWLKAATKEAIDRRESIIARNQQKIAAGQAPALVKEASVTVTLIYPWFAPVKGSMIVCCGRH